MTSSNYAYKTFDDIVFEGRNREYGAYLLRQVYTRNLWKGLVTAISLFMLFLSIPLLVNKFWPEEAIITQTQPTDDGHVIYDVFPEIEPVTPPPPPASEAKPPIQKAQAPTERFTPPVITNNTNAQTDVP